MWYFIIHSQDLDYVGIPTSGSTRWHLSGPVLPWNGFVLIFSWSGCVEAPLKAALSSWARGGGNTWCLLSTGSQVQGWKPYGQLSMATPGKSKIRHLAVGSSDSVFVCLFFWRRFLRRTLLVAHVLSKDSGWCWNLFAFYWFLLHRVSSFFSVILSYLFGCVQHKSPD